MLTDKGHPNNLLACTYTLCVIYLKYSSFDLNYGFLRIWKYFGHQCQRERPKE